MKNAFSVLVLLLVSTFVTATAGAQVSITNVLTAKAGGIMVSVASSEPPSTKSSDIDKPDWFDRAGGRRIDGVNNIWYSLEYRMQNPRVGGFGDQHEIFFRFPVVQEGFSVAILRFYIAEAKEALPKSLEIRTVTTPDPLPINKPEGESWEVWRIRYSMRPSSEYFVTIKPQVGWNEVNITALAKQWLKDPNSNHGVHITATEHRNTWANFEGPLSEKHPPELVLKK